MGRLTGVQCNSCPDKVEAEGNWSGFWKRMKAQGWQKGMDGQVFCPVCVRAGKADDALPKTRMK